MQKSKSYKGIDFIRISELPKDQQTQIRNMSREGLIIKIQTDSTLLTDCILYSDYEKWYNTLYSKMEPIAQDEKLKPITMNALSWIKHRLLPNT